MNAESIAKVLGGRRSGSGWSARCPAHEDSKPSLSLTDENGKVLVHCHAGCEQRAVIDALRRLGMWPEKSQPKTIVVEAYNYTDEAGKLLYQVCRTDPKGFFQRRPDAYGGWINKKSQRQVLYRLREVLEAPIVFVVDGEKDAETLRNRGFVATTNAGGAKSPWLPEFTDVLKGRHVILIPDRDKPGRQRVKRIARALGGKVSRGVILELEDGHDVTEWFQRGHSELELIALLEGEEVPR